MCIRYRPFLIIFIFLGTAVFAQDPELPNGVELHGDPSTPSSVTITCLRQERRLADCFVTFLEIHRAPGEDYRTKELANFEASKDRLVKEAFQNRNQVCTDDRFNETQDLLKSQRTEEAERMLVAIDSTFRSACSANDLSSFADAMSRVVELGAEIESRTCRFESKNYKWPFKYQGTLDDGYWYYQGEPSVDCGAFVMAKMQGSGWDWTFDQRMIVTNPEGKGYAQPCDSIDTQSKYFSLRDVTLIPLDCPFAKFGGL